MNWPKVEEHQHGQTVADEEVFMHLVQDHALIASNMATPESMQKTHNNDHRNWKKHHP